MDEQQGETEVPTDCKELIAWLSPITFPGSVKTTLGPGDKLMVHELYFCKMKHTPRNVIPKYCAKILVDYTTQVFVFFDKHGTPICKAAFDTISGFLSELKEKIWSR